MIGEWNSEDDIAKARPKMIEFLDSLSTLWGNYTEKAFQGF